MMFAFNLLEEKWLPCVMTDNSLHDLSLRDVLLDAENVREIVGDSPPITVGSAQTSAGDSTPRFICSAECRAMERDSRGEEI